jgi:hypothetical protein
MLEKEIEKHLVKRVKELGGIAYKFVSPGNRGVPDRIVFLPGGLIIFVELKAPGKETTPPQDLQQKRLRDLGNMVYTFDNKELIDDFIEFRKQIGSFVETCKK